MPADARPGPVRLTPRGWLVLTVVGTLVLVLLVAGVGAVTTVLAAPDAVPPQNRRMPTVAGELDPSVAPTLPTGQPSPTVSPPAEVPQHGPGTYRRATVPLTNKAPRGKVIRYAVRVENGVPVDPDAAARFIHGVLNDKRSWSGDGSVTWLFAPSGEVDVTASITTPDTTDRLCRPLRTEGKVSCRNQETIALNALRWTRGVPHYDGDLTGYRQYLVNHEFGHFLGYGHVSCPGAGQKAPVMMTQTYSLGKCTKNPWPANDP